MKKLTLLALSALCFAACKKTNTPVQDQLPPITQTGAGTFGCLINGEVYTPQGFEQNKPAFDLIVDPSFQNGNFGLSTFNKKKKCGLILEPIV